jgi:hypothetical protein
MKRSANHAIEQHNTRVASRGVFSDRLCRF